jgi:ABC-type transporter MlaC component
MSPKVTKSTKSYQKKKEKKPKKKKKGQEELLVTRFKLPTITLCFLGQNFLLVASL